MKSEAKIKIIYVIILILGLILSISNPGPVRDDQDQDIREQGESIGVKEGFKFIESRSTVTYKLVQNEAINRVTRLFRLNLNEEAVLRLNKHLNTGKNRKIPRGTEVKLFIQSRPKQVFFGED